MGQRLGLEYGLDPAMVLFLCLDLGLEVYRELEFEEKFVDLINTQNENNSKIDPKLRLPISIINAKK